MRKAEALGLISILFLIWGCGTEPTGLEAPKEGFLRPGKLESKYEYDVEIWLKEEVRDEKNTLLWTSHSKLEVSFAFRWNGFSQVKDFGEMGRFLYDMRIHHFEQNSDIPSLSHEWEEKYGGDPTVVMSRKGQEVKNPLGSMSGDPRKAFLKPGSEVWVSPWGEALRHEGRLSKARYHTRSAPIGQYFFKGFKVEEWAHACFIHVPPEAWDIEEKGQGSLNVIPHVRSPKNQSPVLKRWRVESEKDALHWASEQKQVLPIGMARGLNRAVKHWTHERFVQGVLDKKTGLPTRVEIRDEGSWMEGVTMGDTAGKKGSLPWLKTSFQYSFKAHRP